jgi:hypothetical protein
MNMKKVFLTLFVVLAVLASGCKGKKFSWFGKGNQQEAYVKQLESKMQSDSASHAEELQRMKDESQLTIDSLKTNCGKPKTGERFSYYVITGAFMEQGNADRYKEKMDKMGYTSEIVEGPFGYHMVSVSGSNDLNEAVSVMNTMRNSVTENAWVYVVK